MKAALAYVAAGLCLLIGGLAWRLLPMIFVFMGGLLFIFGLCLARASSIAVPAVEVKLLQGEPTPTMDEFALVKYGYLVEDLRAQYLDRITLLDSCPAVRPILVNEIKRVSAFKRRADLERMVIASANALRDCENFRRGEHEPSGASRPEV